MTLKIGKGLAYLLLTAIIIFLTLLLVVNLKTDRPTIDFLGVGTKDTPPVGLESVPLRVVTDNSGSTKKIESRDTWLDPGEVYRVVDATGSGIFYTFWYSTTSEDVWMRMIIDGNVVWKNPTGVFGYNWAYNGKESGIGGITNYGDSTHLGPVYGVYFKPSPIGLPFTQDLKIEFGNDTSQKQLVYFSTGFYSHNR